MKCIITETINSLIHKEPKEKSFVVIRRHSTIKFSNKESAADSAVSIENRLPVEKAVQAEQEYMSSKAYRPIDCDFLPYNNQADQPLQMETEFKPLNNLRNSHSTLAEREFVPYTSNPYKTRKSDSFRPNPYKAQPQEPQTKEYTTNPYKTQTSNLEQIYTSSPFETKVPIKIGFDTQKYDTFKHPQYVQPPIIQQNVYKIQVPSAPQAQEYPKPHYYDGAQERLGHRLQNDRFDWAKPAAALEEPLNRYANIAEQVDDQDYDDIPYIDDLYSEINVTLSLPRKANMHRFPTRKVFRNVY
ncbi:hypothetical protein HDV01_002506 [Terramyces sp. JEL0728]|nr:hypothetical protein HDV01_002506 [Terramyces sp. JEL0728]